MNIPEINTNLCTGCSMCVDTCPLGAISIENNVAVIDAEECTNCRACESDCPVEAIS